MKKRILSIVAIGSLIALSGCSQPDSKKTYSANQKVYDCGGYEVILTGGSRTVHGVKEVSVPGGYAHKGTSKSIASRMTIDSWAMKPHNTQLLSNGTFRMNNGETWSFRKYNGQYFLGLSKSPNIKNPIAGKWCKRTH